MQIKVRTLTGKEIELNIEPEDKVQNIKEKVEEKEGIPPVQQRLIFGGKQMNDDKSAAEYNLEGGATLHLVLALRDDMPATMATCARESSRRRATPDRAAEGQEGEASQTLLSTCEEGAAKDRCAYEWNMSSVQWSSDINMRHRELGMTSKFCD
ncbi:hypothetical protein AC579_221 [Pseudocercospora musae]|uniref:Ubiquitin-like domain-containing protein n=1 Tax=Pseudocercospora musae TaxID=113226 RepID=A0A139I9J1_9PEZI|nr:hypothetical protein AC579_221 [Pseudocercospora musae]